MTTAEAFKGALMEEKNKHKKKKRQIADDPGPSEQMRDPFVHAL